MDLFQCQHHALNHFASPHLKSWWKMWSTFLGYQAKMCCGVGDCSIKFEKMHRYCFRCYFDRTSDSLWHSRLISHSIDDSSYFLGPWPQEIRPRFHFGGCPFSLGRKCHHIRPRIAVKPARKSLVFMGYAYLDEYEQILHLRLSWSGPGGTHRCPGVDSPH